MKEFKPIAMRCNQQQYDEIKQILLDNGCKCRLDDTFDERPYLTNNFSTIENNINNTINSLKDNYNRTVFETWNKDVFLEYCGIEIKTEYIVGKWYKLPKHNWYLKHLNMTNNKWFYNERIMCNLNGYDFVIDWCDNNTEFTLLTDLSEIQQYLPDNHPDKITAKPIETKSKYQIAAEKALEKFKDIQIGDEYMTIRGNRYIANTLPKIKGGPHAGVGCYIDCGSGFLWKYNEPDKFGYKINKQNSTEINAYPLPPNPIIASNQLIKKIQPIQLIRKKKIVMDTKINPIKSINTNLKIKNQKLWI